jgi:hypothetical protein
MIDLPRFALSVRQPWAWAIIHAGKNIENRGHVAITKGGMKRGRIAVHASKGMTQEEYAHAYDFMRSIDVVCPPPGALIRGGIIGTVDVVDVVTKSASPWFFGPRGLVLANALACDPIPCSGALGYFEWKESGAIEQSLKWMRPKSDLLPPATVPSASVQPSADLFDQLTTCQRPESER